MRQALVAVDDDAPDCLQIAGSGAAQRREGMWLATGVFAPRLEGKTRGLFACHTANNLCHPVKGANFVLFSRADT